MLLLSYLCHESVGLRVLLVFEYDVRVVVANEFVEPFRVARDFCLLLCHWHPDCSPKN